MKQHSCVLQQIRKSNRHSVVARHHITQVKPHGLEKVNIKFMLWLLYSLLLPEGKAPVPGPGGSWTWTELMGEDRNKKIFLLLPVTKSNHPICCLSLFKFCNSCIVLWGKMKD
jgi:uncharacterized protein with PQ loop repeat